MKKFFFVFILVFSSGFIYAQSSDSLSVEQLLSKGRYTKVVDLLSVRDTLSDKEHYQLGTAFLNLMKYREALIHFSKAVRSDAQNTDYLFMMANVDELMGRPILAKYFYDRVLKIDSTFYTAKLKLANVLMDIKNYAKAAKLYGELAEKDSLNDYLIRRLSICKIKNRDTTAALNLLNRIFKAGTYNSKSALLLAKIYFSKEEYDSAIAVMNAALKRDKMDMELNRFAAEVYFKLKRYRSAITKYLQSVTFGDSTAEVYQKLGLSYYSLANSGSLKKGESSEKFLENAFETLTISDELDGKNPITAMYLGLIYKDKKDYKSAMEYFELALEVGNDPVFNGVVDTSIIYNAGLSAYNGKLWNKAIEYLGKAKDMGYGGGATYVLLKNAYLEKGDTLTGLKVLQEGFHKNPTDKTIIFELINYYLLVEDNSQAAIDYINKALEQDTSNASLYFAKGLALDKLGKHDEAIQAYKLSIAKDPNYLNAYYNLGAMIFNDGVTKFNKCNEIMDNEKFKECVAEADKIFKESLPYLEKAHELDPKEINTLETLKVLYYRLHMYDKRDQIVKELEAIKNASGNNQEQQK